MSPGKGSPGGRGRGDANPDEDISRVIFVNQAYSYWRGYICLHQVHATRVLIIIGVGYTVVASSFKGVIKINPSGSWT
jgi:hypothetical protein